MTVDEIAADMDHTEPSQLSQYTEELSVLLSDTIRFVTLCEWIKEAAYTSKKQDTTLALNN